MRQTSPCLCSVQEGCLLEENGGTGGRASAFELARAALLGDGPLQEKLHAIVQGDPLRLFDRAEEATRSRCLWLSPFRVCDESVFTAIALASEISKTDDLDDWLYERVNDAIDNLLRRDWEALIHGEITEDMVAENTLYLASVLGCEPGAALRAATRFNALPERIRRAHFAVFVEGKSVAECLEAGLGPAEQLEQNVRHSSKVILDEVAAFRMATGTRDSRGGQCE